MRSFLLLVHCVGVVLSASYYQGNYSGYLFTIPGFNDAERRSQMDAQAWCNGNRSKLLAITDPNIQSAAVAFIKDAITQNQMTGNTIITDGQRANGDWTWINGMTAPTLQITAQEGGLGYSYAYLYVAPALSSFSLSASTPTDKKYFICEGQVFCGNGYQIQGQCFQSFRNDSDWVSWFEARNRCLQRGGDLATFEFITNNDGVKALNGSWLTQSSHYWIGLRRQWWTWQSIYSNVTYSQWSDGKPIYYDNPQCICLLPNDWRWSECQCDQTFQFVCILSPAADVSSTSQSMTSSTLTSNDSSSSTATTINNSQTSVAQNSTPNDLDTNQKIALGVGIGGGILLLLVIVIVVFILRSRKGHTCFKRERAMAKESPTHSDVTDVTPLEPTTAIYADVMTKDGKQGPNDMESTEKGDNDEEQIQYAEFQIVDPNKTPQNGLELRNVPVSTSHRDTIVPPSFTKLSDDNDDVEYGQIDKR